MKLRISVISALLVSLLAPVAAHAIADPVVGVPRSESATGAAANEGAVSVTWDPVDGAVTYSVAASATGFPTQSVSSNCPNVPCTVTIGDLRGGVTHDFTVTAFDSNAAEAQTTVQFVPKTVADAPTVVSSTAGVGQITLTWAAPVNTGGLTVTGYKITASDGSTSKNVTSESTSTIMTGLTAGKSYTFRVTATNALGNSPVATFSATSVLSAPDAPTQVAAEENQGTISVQWQAPVDNGGTDITSYTAYLQRDGVDVGAPVVTGNTSASFSGVAAGDYVVQVLATNAAGSSPRSVASNEVTIAGAALLPNVPVFSPSEIADVEVGANAVFTVTAAPSSVVTLSVSADPSGACRLVAGRVNAVAVGTCSVTATASATSTHASGVAVATFDIVADEDTAPTEPEEPEEPTVTNPPAGGGGFIPTPTTSPADPISSSPLAAGNSIALVGADGTVVAATPTIASDSRSLQITVGSVGIALGADSGLKFNESGKATLDSGAKVEFSGSGYQPQSTVAGYLIPLSSLAASGFVAQNSAAISLGTTTVGSSGTFTSEFDISADPGAYLLQLSGTSETGEPITLALEAQIQGDQTLAVWTKRLPGNTQAKLYAKSVVGVGKVQFFFNGREIAWVRAVDETDPKLRVITSGPMTGANYLVRTVDLKLGKNVLEIYLDGERIRRTAYGR